MPVEELEAPAATEEVTNATESATEEQQEPQEGKPPVSAGAQKRIDRLTREKNEAIREVEYLRNLQNSKPAPVVTNTTPEATGKPSENDFQTHAEFLEALTDWKVDQKLNAAKANERVESVKTKQQQAAQAFKDKQDSFREMTPDFDDVLETGAAEIGNLTQLFIDELVQSDNGPELQYYFAKNPEEAKRINALAPLAMARAMGRIESRFTTSQGTPPANVTKAPPPPNPGARSTSTSTKDPGDMSPAEYRAWFAKQNA